MKRDGVGEFFDQHAEGYRGRPAGMQLFHRETARRIEAGLSGRVLSLGGLWGQADPSAVDGRILVTDLSYGMLRTWHREGFSAAQTDALCLPFADASFDHVVLPLVLHHVAGSSAREARRLAAAVLNEVARVTRPGGWLWISELCPAEAVYRIQRWLAPLTRWLLGLAGQPLVLMHTARFYIAQLTESEEPRWEAIQATEIEAPGAHPTDWIQPVIAVPKLRIPRYLFPLRPTLIQSRRRAPAPPDEGAKSSTADR